MTTSDVQRVSIVIGPLTALAVGAPLISRTGGVHADGDAGFVLPSHGAAISVMSDRHMLGHLVLRPQSGITSLWVERRVVVALADHLAIALTYTGHETGRNSSPKGKIANG